MLPQPHVPAALRHRRQMADLAGQSRMPLQEPTAQHHAQADARTNIEHREVVDSPRQAVVAFRQAQSVRLLQEHALAAPTALPDRPPVRGRWSSARSATARRDPAGRPRVPAGSDQAPAWSRPASPSIPAQPFRARRSVRHRFPESAPSASRRAARRSKPEAIISQCPASMAMPSTCAEVRREPKSWRGPAARQFRSIGLFEQTGPQQRCHRLGDGRSAQAALPCHLRTRQRPARLQQTKHLPFVELAHRHRANGGKAWLGSQARWDHAEQRRRLGIFCKGDLIKVVKENSVPRCQIATSWGCIWQSVFRTAWKIGVPDRGVCVQPGGNLRG